MLQSAGLLGVFLDDVYRLLIGRRLFSLLVPDGECGLRHLLHVLCRKRCAGVLEQTVDGFLILSRNPAIVSPAKFVCGILYDFLQILTKYIMIAYIISENTD